MSQRSATTRPAAATPPASTLVRAGVSTQDNSPVANDTGKEAPRPAAKPLLVPIRNGRPDEPPPPLDFSRIAVNGSAIVHIRGAQIPDKHATEKHAPDKRILDTDSARAQLTRRLLAELAPALGLDLSRLRITVTAAGGARIEARGASALQEDQNILLHPQRYRPETDAGRYLLAHEAAHAAQRRLAGTPDVRAAETEADVIGRAFAARERLQRPSVALPTHVLAADTDATKELPFELVAMQNHEPEMARIRQLLGGLWISDGDVDQVLLILKTLPPPTAEALIGALSSSERVDLVDNMHSVHRKHFRPEVLICYSALTDSEINAEFDEDLFEDMDLSGLTVLEVFTCDRVVKHLKQKNRIALLKSDNGAVIRLIEQFAPDPDNRARWEAEASDQLQKARAEEQALAKTIQETKAVWLKDQSSGGALSALVESIRARLDAWVVTDKDAMGILGDLVPYVHDMPTLRAIADGLVTHSYVKQDDGAYWYHEDKDYLQALIDQVPVKALYAQNAPERKVFLQLLLARTGYKSIESVLRLTDEINVKIPIIGMLINSISGFFSHVDSEEAYLAYQLVRSMPARARRAIMEYEEGGPWGRVTANLSTSQREAETTHFYQGGKNGEDRDSILTQLMFDETWTQAGRLRGIAGQAMAAGHYDFVFAESKRRYDAGGAKYANDDILAEVETLKLYNPDAVDHEGNAAPRLSPDSKIMAGNPFWNEGNLGWINQKVVGGLDFIFSSKDVETATTALGGTGLNLVEFQDITGGSFLGARFESLDKLGVAGEQAKRDKRGVNFADVKWDRNLGVLELQAEHLAIAAINYPLSDMTIRTGRIDLRNVAITLRYPTASTKNQLNVIDIYIGEAEVDNLMLITPDSMKSVNETELEQFRLLIHPSGKDLGQMDKPRDGLLVDGVGGVFADIFLFPVGGASGVGAMANVVNSADSGKELGANFFKPSSGMNLEISLGSLKLKGVTTSGGSYIESIVVENLDIAGGGTVEAYLDALKYSAVRLETRMKRERKALDASSDETQRGVHEKAIGQLQKQIEHAQAEIAQVKANQARIAGIEERQKALSAEKPPRELPKDERDELKKLKASLLGTVMDVGRVKISGIADSPVKNLDLGNLHGQGNSTTAMLGMLSDSDTLSRFIEGGNPVVKKAPGPQDNFTLDIGHVELPDLKLTGSIPKPEDAQHDLDAFLKKMDPSRPEHIARKQQLEQRIANAQRYDSYLKLDPEQLTDKQRGEFLDARRQLLSYEEENAFRIRAVTMEGASLRFGAEGSVGIGADELTAVGLVDPKTGLKIDSAYARRFSLDARVKDGVLGLKDWRKNLQSGRLSAAYLQIKGLDDPDSGIGADEIAFESSDERAALDVSLDINGGNASARIASPKISIKGATVAFSERLMRAAKARLELRDETTLTPAQKEKRKVLLKKLDRFLENLDAIHATIAQDQLALAQATEAKDQARADAASKALAIDRESLKYWLQQVSLAELTATDLDLSLSGLGDVLDKDWSLDKAIDGGITIEAGKPDGAMVGGVVLKTLSSRQLGPDTINAEEIALGPIKGSIVYSSTYIRIRNLEIPTVAVEGLSYISPESLIWSDGRSTISNLTVSAIIHYSPKPDAERPNQTYMSKVDVDEFHIDRIDAKDIGYEHYEKGMRVDVASGALRDITMRALSFELSPDELDDMKIHEDKSRATKDKSTGIHVAAFDDVKVAVAMTNGLTAKGKLNASSLDVHFAESGGKEIDLASLTVAEGKVKKGDLDLDVDADVKGIHVSLLPGGLAKGRAKDVSIGVKGSKGKHSFDAKIDHADTGEISYDGTFLDMPALDLPSIKLNSLSVNSPDFGLQIPGGSPAELIGLKASVSIEMNHDAKAGDPPVKRIYIYSLAATSLTTKGFTATLPSKGLTIVLPSTSSGLISDISMTPGEEYPEAFVIDAEHDWNLYGSLGFKSGTMKKLGADLPKLWVQHADLTLGAFSMGFLGNKGNTIELAKATLENIDGKIAGSDFTVIKGDVKQGGTAHKDATPGLTITGFKKNADGDISIEGIDLQGFRYHNKEIGLSIDLKQAQLAKRKDGKPAFEMRKDGSILIPELDISEADFHIDDVLNMGGSSGGGSKGLDYGPDWNFMDKLNGKIDFDVHAHGHWAINVFDSEYQVRIPIKNGQFDYSEVEDNALGLGDAAVDFFYTAPQYGGAIPARFNISIAGSRIWWDLNSDEATLAAGNQIKISTFFKHKPQTPPTMPWHSPPTRSLDQLSFYNVDIDLKLPGKTRIELGNAGYIQLADSKSNLPFRFQASDSTGNHVKSLLLNLSAHVSEMQLKTDTLGSRLSTGAIDISSVGLTRLDFAAADVGPDRMDMPKAMNGRIESAKARDIQWTPAAKKATK
ncbi:MAG: DUF4157 domain-containing protein [Lysobacter sp.]|nr:DUF4157 domain-containing protein [Lysobacter sp.]